MPLGIHSSIIMTSTRSHRRRDIGLSELCSFDVSNIGYLRGGTEGHLRISLRLSPMSRDFPVQAIPRKISIGTISDEEPLDETSESQSLKRIAFLRGVTRDTCTQGRIISISFNSLLSTLEDGVGIRLGPGPLEHTIRQDGWKGYLHPKDCPVFATTAADEVGKTGSPTTGSFRQSHLRRILARGRRSRDLCLKSSNLIGNNFQILEFALTL